MILSEFAKYLQDKDDEIIEKKSCTSLLMHWIKDVLGRIPKTKAEKVIHTEIAIAKNKMGDYLLVAKSPSGQKLTQSLYNYALSYEQHAMAKWIQDKKPSDFE